MQNLDEKNFLKEGENIDDLQLDGLRLIQNKAIFSFGIDAVLLSSIAEVRDGGSILDIGSGNGIIPLLLSSKTKAKEIVGIEIQDYVCDMARRSVEMNGLGDRISIIEADVREEAPKYREAFDSIVSNPPYFKHKTGLISDNSSKMCARHEISLNIDELFQATALMLKNKGRLYLIHRPSRLVDIFFYARKHKLEPKKARMVVSKRGEEAKLVLLELVKNGGSELRWEGELVIYEEDGSYTEEIKKIYSISGVTSFTDKHKVIREGEEPCRCDS